MRQEMAEVYSKLRMLEGIDPDRVEINEEEIATVEGKTRRLDISIEYPVEVEEETFVASWKPSPIEVTEIKIDKIGIHLNGDKIEFSGETQERLDDEPEYDQEEAVEFIQNEIYNRPNTELFKMLKGKYTKESLRFILDAEEDYMRHKGIIED